MNTRLATCALIVIVVGAFPLLAPARQDEKRKPSPEQVQEWMKHAEPGEHHKMLEPLVGKWDLSVTMPDEAGVPGEPVKGTSEFRWAMGKRFLVEETRTTAGGQPFEWMGFHGYDNRAKQFVAAFIDNFGTDIDHMTGQPQDGGRTIAYVGETADGPGGRQKFRWVIHVKGPNELHIEMFLSGPEGKESRVMEIVGKRAG